jgi:hypothetical protein
MKFEPIHCEGLLSARAAAWRGEIVNFPRSDLVSVNTSGLYPYLVEEAIENIRRWAIRLVPFTPVEECIKLAAQILIHPEEGAAICNSIDSETYCTMRLFFPAADDRN